MKGERQSVLRLIPSTSGNGSNNKKSASHAPVEHIVRRGYVQVLFPLPERFFNSLSRILALRLYFNKWDSPYCLSHSCSYWLAV